MCTATVMIANFSYDCSLKFLGIPVMLLSLHGYYIIHAVLSFSPSLIINGPQSSSYLYRLHTRDT